MNRSTTLWTCIVLAGAGVCASGCKPNSDTTHAQREGGVPDPRDTDGGIGGQDGVDDDDYRPPLAPPIRPPRPPRGGEGAKPHDAGAIDSGHVVDPPPVDAGVDSGNPDDDDAGLPDSGAHDAGPPDSGIPTEIIVAELCAKICQRGVSLDCEYNPTYDECRSLCQEPVVGCDREHIEVLTCKAECPMDGYYCDEDFGAFEVTGCEEFDAALLNCRLTQMTSS